MTRFLAPVLLGAVLVHFAALAALPRVVMHLAMERMRRAPVNEFAHTPLATSEARAIVRPSPDLAYSALVFDVSEHPLEVRVPITAPYTSLSGFAANTDNFFAFNDQHPAFREEIQVVLTGPSWRARRAGVVGLATAVDAPSDRGILLVRRVVPSPEAFAEIDTARRRATSSDAP